MNSSRKRSKAIVVTAVGVGAVIFVLAAFSFRQPILEQYYLWKLESGESRDKEIAAKQLGGIKSKRAIPLLAALLLENESGSRTELHYTTDALAEIGLPAVPELLDLARTENRYHFSQALIALGCSSRTALWG